SFSHSSVSTSLAKVSAVTERIRKACPTTANILVGLDPQGGRASPRCHLDVPPTPLVIAAACTNLCVRTRQYFPLCLVPSDRIRLATLVLPDHTVNIRKCVRLSEGSERIVSLRFAPRLHRRKALHPRHSWPHRKRGMKQLWRPRRGPPIFRVGRCSPSPFSSSGVPRPAEGLLESECRCDPG